MRRPSETSSVAVVSAAVVVFVVSTRWAVPAFGQSSMTVTPPSVPPGGAVVIAGTVPVTGAASCPPGDPAQLTSTAALFPPDGFGPAATRDAAGAFRSSYSVPATTPVGTYTIVVRCGGGNTGIAATLQVTQEITTTAQATTTTGKSVTTTLQPTTTTLPSTTTTTGAPAEGKGSSNAGWIALAIAGGAVVVAAASAAAGFVRRRHRR